MNSSFLTRLLVALPALALAALATAVPLDQPVIAPSGVLRLWTDTTGRQVEATFRGIENGEIYLQTRNGFVYRLPLSRLSPEDQKMAAQLKPEGLGIPRDPSLAQAAAVIDKGVLLGLEKAKQQPNPLASDEQFIRRVYLDLNGRIPTREETIAFLEDKSDSKRAKVIDKLIQSEGFSSHLFNYFSDMLRLAHDAQKAKFYTYEEWFKNQLAANRPYNEIVRELLSADGKLLENGATGYLLRDRGMRLDNLSLTLSSFLGANVACAQCHDHPFADWTQKQFFQMAAFFGASEVGVKARTPALRGLREELGNAAFQQARRLMDVNSLLIRDGSANDLTLPNDYKYKDGKPGDPVAPALVTWGPNDHRLRCYQDAEAGLKKLGKDEGALRDIFARWMTSPDNPRFAMTIANRLWKLVFGVGLKEPVTDLDDPNAASNPALLHHLGNEMVRLKFDLRAFMRLLCNTQTYQREAVTRELELGEAFLFPGPILRRMTAEQAWDSCVTLAIGEKIDAFKAKRGEAYAQVMNMNVAEADVEAIKEKLTAMQSLRKKGMLETKGKAKAKAKRKAAPTMAEDETDAQSPETLDGLVLARASELRQPERDNHFLRMFGQSDRQICDSNSLEGSVPQVLMLMNGEAQSVLGSSSARVTATAMGMTKPEEKVEALYLSFFSRRPSAGELGEAVAALNGGLQSADLAWVLFNAREFVFVQ